MAELMYTLVEVADITGAKVRTVRWWVTQGKLAAVKVKPSAGYPWLVSETSLKQFMEDRENGNRKK